MAWQREVTAAGEPFPAGIHGLVRNQYRHGACKQQTVPVFALGGVRASDASLLALPFLLLGLPTLSRNRLSLTEARYGEKYIVEHAWSHASLCKPPTRTCSGWARRQVAVGGRLQRWDSRKHRARCSGNPWELEGLLCSNKLIWKLLLRGCGHAPVSAFPTTPSLVGCLSENKDHIRASYMSPQGA